MAAFGRYELISVLGQGGFATVHRAHDPVLDRDVAIKVLHGYLAGDAQVGERFVREGRALARIRHPNLVQIYDAGTMEGQTFLAMEFVDGRSLAALSAGRQMPLEETARIISQVAGAIDAVHASGLIHRDIKPANIIVEPGGRAVLLDLGIARDMETTSVTATGLVVGTPGFLAPEQVDSSVFVGPGTDVYQLAATTYTLLAGKPPYEGDTAQVLYSVAHKPPPDLGAVRPDLPYQVVAAVTQALAKDPNERPVSATAFADVLAGRQPSAAPATAVAVSPTLVAAAPEPAPADPSTEETVVQPTPVPAAPRPTPSPVQAAPAAAAARPAAQPSSGSRRPLVIAGAVLAAVVVAAGAAFALAGGGDGGTDAREETPQALAAPGDIRPDGQEVEVHWGANSPKSLTFRAPASGVVSFVVKDSSVGATYTVVDDRDDSVGISTWVPEDGGLVEPVELPEAGDYALRITGQQAGSARVVMYEVPKPAETPAKPGSEFELHVDVPGATARAAVDVKAGQRFSVSVLSTTKAFNLSVARGDAPDDALVTIWIPPDGGFIDAFEVREDGKLLLTADPVHADTVKAKLRVNELKEEKLVTLPFGTPTEFKTSVPGENARFGFTGKADQVVSIRTAKVQKGSNLRLRRAGEADDLKVIWSPSPSGTLLVSKLPDAGQYLVIVDPPNESLDSGTIAIYDVTERPTASGSVGSGSITVRTSLPGQVATITFQGTAGQTIGVRSRGENGYFATVTAPNGDVVRDRQWLPGNFVLEDLKLQHTGQYEILLESPDGSPMAFTLELQQR